MTEKRAVILNEQRFGLAEQMRQDWVVNAEEGTLVNDVLEPGYWAHIAYKMQVYDRIDVRLETGEWLMELVVLDVGRNYARVHLAKKHDFVETNLDAPVSAIKHKVEFKGPQRKWAVIRIADSAVVQEGFQGKAEAILWLQNHERVTETT